MFEAHGPSRLFTVSLLILFAEVMCIRWLSVELPLLRIFPNLTLMVIFVSVSVGLSTYKKPNVATPVILAACVFTIGLLLVAKPLHLESPSLNSVNEIFCSLVAIAFVVINLMAIFTSLGRVLGREFAKLPALKAYSVNLLGSLLGVALFGIISYLSIPPAIWLLIATLCAFALTNKKYVLALGASLCIGAGCAYANSIWSPYGCIQIIPNKTLDRTILGQGNYTLRSNGDFFHGATHIVPVASFESIGKVYKNLTRWQRDYRYWLELPYILSPKSDKVLVLGAGSGNDVQCALLHGAKLIDAVEIDPFIASCGRKRHPDRPYTNPAVHVHVEDARTFLRYSKNKYDLIQFAYLDPGCTVKISSFLRSDNFVYTTESLRSALNHLTPEGVVSLSFASGPSKPATRRLYETIRSAYGKPPLSLFQDYTGSCFFFFGPGVKQPPQSLISQGELRVWPQGDEYRLLRAATDDWPFLYLDFDGTAVYAYFYILFLAALMPLAGLIKGPSERIVLPELIPMFFLGMAFMLMETKSITALSLLFGSTWMVSSLVIATMLSLAFAGNQLADVCSFKSVAPWYGGLTAALILDYCYRVPSNSTANPILLSLTAALVCCLPVFFGGVIFSILLKRSSSAVLPLSANVMGVAFGGLLENVCIVAGIKSLSLLALGLYLISALPLATLAKQRPAN